MARPGVTYQDVSGAASELKGQGKSITIENIRALLGTGSIGTINKYLRQWREAQNSTLKISSQTNIPDELVSVLKGLWDRVMTQSAEQFIPIEEELRNEIAGLKEEAEKYKSNNQRWQKLFNQWQQEKTQLANEKLTSDQALEFSHKENASLHAKQDGLQQQLQDKQERINELHRLHKQAQENLEHYRESTREQRALNQQQFEQQKQQLQFEIKNLNEQSSVQRDKLSGLQQQNQSLQQSYKALKDSHEQIQIQLQQILVQLNAAEKSKAEYLHVSQHWQDQCKKIQTDLSDQINQLIDKKTENKLLLHELQEAKKDLITRRDQLKLLSQEKWELAQEKAQLEGQLKQIQKTVTA